MNLDTGHTRAIIAECQAQGLTVKQAAYVLATTRHETGGKMVPVEENLRYTSASRLRAVWPSRFTSNAAAAPYVNNPEGLANLVYGGRMGNTAPGDGWKYRGRGYPQTTGRTNYATAQVLTGHPVVDRPDLMLDPDIAAMVMVRCMKDGLYTGKSLSDYINDTGTYYVAARRIINGTDQAETVADYAEEYERLLSMTPAKELQSILGVTPDGIWGPKSQAALEAFTAKAERVYSLSKEL